MCCAGKCAPGFHMMGGDEAMEKYEICMGANLTCMNDMMNRMGRWRLHLDILIIKDL